MRFRAFAAGLALLAHTSPIVALCLCPPDVVAEIKGRPAPMDCHETQTGVSLSSLDDCCCLSDPAEGTSSKLAVKRTLDEISFSTPLSGATSMAPASVPRASRPAASRDGSAPPRPLLRV